MKMGKSPTEEELDALRNKRYKNLDSKCGKKKTKVEKALLKVGDEIKESRAKYLKRVQDALK